MKASTGDDPPLYTKHDSNELTTWGHYKYHPWASTTQSKATHDAQEDGWDGATGQP